MRRLDLTSLRFGESSELRRDLPVEVAAFVVGGLKYAVVGSVIELELSASRVGTRLTLRGNGEAALAGPCQRCLNDAEVALAVSCEDYVRSGESEGADADERYSSGWCLDLERWVRDAIADQLPAQILCRCDCLGLCQTCGVDLNEVGADHVHQMR